MIQVDSGYSIKGTRKQLKEQMPYLKFRGTGFYLRPSGFILIIPADPQADDRPWKPRGEWPKDTVFRAYYYLCAKKLTMYRFIPKGVVPTYKTEET